MGISHKIWNAVKIACTIIVAAGVIFNIWTHLIRPTAKLSAVVEYSNVYWPPTCVKAADKLDELTEYDNIRKAIDPNLNHETFEISLVFSKYLTEGLSEFRDSLRKHSGLYRIQVTNNGKRICSGVSAKLPYQCLVELTREDNTRELLENASVITIGDLKPKEKVSLKAWSNNTSEYTLANIRITHDLGIASIDKRKPVGYLGRWVDKYAYWFGFAFSLALFALASLLHFSDWPRKQEIEEKPQELDKEKLEDLIPSSDANDVAK